MSAEDRIAWTRYHIARGRWDAEDYEPMALVRRTVTTEWEEVPDA